MTKFACFFLLTLLSVQAFSQKLSVAQIKVELEKSPNPPLYVKDVLKKRFKLDTVVVSRTAYFSSMADSLAYKGKIKKVYGPFTQQGIRFLVQVLAKLPNTFNRISQIFIDTSIFRYRIADSLGKSIIARVNRGDESFEQFAQTYSMGGEAATRGDLGWIAKGTMIPEIERELPKHKRGQVFSVWSRSGLHIIKKTEEPRQDDGVALMMRIFL